MIKEIKLQKVRFSQDSYDQMKEKLLEYPEQVCNTKEAMEGLVMEFVPLGQPDAPVGALSEYNSVEGYNKFIIFDNDDKILLVTMDEDKRFILHE